MKNLILLLSFTFFAQLSQAKITFIDVDDVATWEKILRLAKADQANILIFLKDNSLSCPTCKQLKKNTFKDKDLKKYIGKNYIAVETRNYSEFGQALLKLYRLPSGYPQMLALNASEQLFYVNEGFIAASDFINALKIAEQKLVNIQDFVRKNPDSLSINQWIDYLDFGYINGRIMPNSPEIRSIGSRLDSADYAQQNVLDFTMNLGLDVDYPIFKTVAEHPNWFTDTLFFDQQLYYEKVFNYNITKAIAAKDSILLEDVLFQMSKLNIMGSIPNVALKGRQLYLAEINHWDAYDSITMAYLKTLPEDSVNTYQREAMYIMEYYSRGKAQNVAYKFLEAGIKKKETYELMYTLSLWLYNNGEYLLAYKAAYRSYELARTTEQRELAARMVIMLEGY